MAEHFKQHVQPNGFKAMLACYDKETCVLYKAALDTLLGSEVSLCIFSEAPKEDGELIKAHYLGDAARKKAIDEFKKPKPDKAEELAKPENRFRKVELFIVCDMLLTGFDAPILQTLYLDKGLRNHTLLQAIARVNRPYNELKNGWGDDGTQGRGGLVIDYFGVFENLNEALNFDKNELGTIAYPFSLLRERFKLEIGLLSDLFKEVDRTGSYESLMKALTFLNQNEPARDKFEELYRNVRILYEALQPDEFLADYEREYAWLTKMWMAYRKKFYPAERFEISAEDGAKTRELIRQNVSMEELKKDFPTYELNEQYLSKLKDEPPDAKALDIEAMLAAELKIRLGEDEDYQPLSERLKQIVSNKRQGTLAGIALIAELSKLAEEVVRLTEERKLPLPRRAQPTTWPMAYWPRRTSSAFRIGFRRRTWTPRCIGSSRSCWPGSSATSHCTARARTSWIGASSCSSGHATSAKARREVRELRAYAIRRADQPQGPTRSAEDDREARAGGRRATGI